MIKVKNKNVLRTLSGRSLKANRGRNLIAILAIALTTIMFTALFTIVTTIGNSYEQSSFQQAGGDIHGTFKNVTPQQIEELTADPLIVKYGLRQTLGLPTDPPFQKSHVEVSYMDAICAEGHFSTPQQGQLPKEGTNEIACDTRILKLLGIKPEIGAEVTLPYYIGEEPDRELITDTFVLSGWWESDTVNPASHAIVPRSYGERIISGYDDAKEHGITGRWDLNIYLESTKHIEKDMETVLQNSGYQDEDKAAENYIATGVNWSYLGAQMEGRADAGTSVAIGVLLLLIIFTGYLIIYNIFQISVASDIRFYGLLKTIGTTGKQIRTMVRRQAMLLSAVGIPVGMLFGYLCGNVMTPSIMSMMSYKNVHVTVNPLIFVGSALFALGTVLISCRKPAAIAARVSPVEAVRYTESTSIRQTVRKKNNKTGVFGMALANLSRSRKRTVLVLISLSLSVVLLQVTVTFTNGFDMDKYMEKKSIADFILADSSYFQARSFFSAEAALPEGAIEAVNGQGGIADAGRVYGTANTVIEYITEEWFAANQPWYTPEQMTEELSTRDRDAEGRVENSAQLYGMEDFALDHLKLVEGDLSPLYDPEQNAIAAVYVTDDYGNVAGNSHWAKVGDTIRLRYVDEWQYTDEVTGEILEDPESSDNSYRATPVTFRDVTYTVAATVTVNHSMSYRFYGDDQFVLNGDVFKRDSGTENVMLYMADTTKEANARMESFISDYTENTDSTLSYESRESCRSQFESFRNIFVMMGGVLCAVTGFVGILNFFNAVMTSIMTRRREFAMLQSIGMTGRQLKQMLIWEGIGYGVLTTVLSLVLSLIVGPALGVVMNDILWLFTYRFTILPVLMFVPVFLVLGVVLPLIIYRFASRQTIVERLRAAE